MGHWLRSVAMLIHGMTFNLGSASVCSPATFELYFPYHKVIWIAVTDYYMDFYLIVLFPLTILQLIMFIATNLLLY